MKPQVLDFTEWEFPGWRRQRAELMTRLPGQPASPTDALHENLQLPASWWDELRTSLDWVATVPTERVHKDQQQVSERVQAAFGASVEVVIRRWETVHGDLHWANLPNPFAIVDWELWGRGPAGTDAATLYCYSLLVPAVAANVRAVFADVLDTDDGATALTSASARLLRRIAGGDHPELETPTASARRRPIGSRVTIPAEDNYAVRPC